MLNHCKYDCIKLLHEMSSLLWFIEQYAKEDAKKEGNTECLEKFQAIAQDLEKHIDSLKSMMCK